MVRVTGLEPARGCHQNLNLARLPISPHPHLFVYIITFSRACQSFRLIFPARRDILNADSRSVSCSNSRIFAIMISKGGRNMDQQKIGRFIKTLSTENGLTQEQLAEVLGVTNRSVSRWENGVSHS